MTEFDPDLAREQCPCCASKEIEHDSDEWDSDVAYRYFRCRCGAAWRLVYVCSAVEVNEAETAREIPEDHYQRLVGLAAVIEWALRVRRRCDTEKLEEAIDNARYATGSDRDAALSEVLFAAEHDLAGGVDTAYRDEEKSIVEYRRALEALGVPTQEPYEAFGGSEINPE